MIQRVLQQMNSSNDSCKQYKKQQEEAFEKLEKAVTDFSQENHRDQEQLQQKWIDETKKSSAKVNEVIQTSNALLAKP